MSYYVSFALIALAVVALVLYFRRGRLPYRREGIWEFTSPHVESLQACAVPAIIYGHMAQNIARMISTSTTQSCIAVIGLRELEEVLKTRQVHSIIAMSRTTAVGEAGEAIHLFRDLYQSRGMALYGAWDYNVARAVDRAISYEADGIVMPGILSDELFAYLRYAQDRVLAGEPRPSSLAEHEEILRKCCPTSPFWNIQDAIESRYH